MNWIEINGKYINTAKFDTAEIKQISNVQYEIVLKSSGRNCTIDSFYSYDLAKEFLDKILKITK